MSEQDERLIREWDQTAVVYVPPQWSEAPQRTGLHKVSGWERPPADTRRARWAVICGLLAVAAYVAFVWWLIASVDVPPPPPLDPPWPIVTPSTYGPPPPGWPTAPG